MAARRAVQAKALASNSNSSATLGLQQQQVNRSRIKSTSMTNLLAPSSDPQGQHHQQASRPIQRPASRNALDSIHKGMNAKFTHVQSKVLLQNIRPQQQSPAGSKIPSSGSSTLTRPINQNNARAKTHTPTPGAKIQQSDRSQLINKIKALQEELASQEQLRDELKQELEREKADKQEQLAQMKLEIEDKARDSERQNEEYHQKLLEAYELADQNRRAADSVLSESRQREEELRKKIDELEQQLGELKEFVSMKEEMQSKMAELREQIRVERERYEEKTRGLNQMFETEKISPHMRVDQNSNYFKRVKGSLQSSESINRLGEPETSGQMNGTANGATSRHHRSQSDIYGSKLSTRMQDGAKFAWKKSRKFASSVITGGLGGISSCRKRDRTLAKSQSDCAAQATNGNYVSANLQVLGAHVARGGAIEVAPREIVVREQPHLFQQPEVGTEQHTSVIEVGEQQQQPQHHQQQAHVQPNDHQRELANGFDKQQTSSSTSQQQQQHEDKQQISVDENNKLTIVTKFNADSAECPQQPASTSSNSSSSERSRCESSSSGRGTASDCGSSTSQNGDVERPKTPPSSMASKTSETTPKTNDSVGGPVEAAEYQRHKRKSSLFKASEMLSGSQASLNKTFKSFFARKLSSQDDEPTGQAMRRHHHSFDQAIPFDLANKTAFQEPPRLESFKQMGDLARDSASVSQKNGEANNNEICQGESTTAAHTSNAGHHHNHHLPATVDASAF